MNQIVCRKIQDDFIPDANADKPVWKDAQAVRLLDTVTGETPRQGTTVKTAFSGNYLYILFVCEDKEIRASMTRFNDLLYEEDVVEVFLDRDGSGREYTEIELNPHNAILHYLIRNDLQGNLFSFAAIRNVTRSAVDYNGSILTAELAIPFSVLTGPDGNISGWRVNFYRIDRGINPDEDEYTAWGPTGKCNFHIPGSFGRLVFEN